MRIWLEWYDQSFRVWQTLVVFPAVMVFERAARPVLAGVLAMAGDDADDVG